MVLTLCFYIQNIFLYFYNIAFIDYYLLTRANGYATVRESTCKYPVFGYVFDHITTKHHVRQFLIVSAVIMCSCKK